MIAVLGGLGAACAFATAMLCSSRSARMIGSYSALSFVMLVGLAITVPWTVAVGVPDELGARAFGWLLVSGAGNVVGLLLSYSALRVGKVGIVAPIVSTEGAIAAVIAVLAGESIAPGAGVTLAVIVAGIVLAGITQAGGNTATAGSGGRTTLLAIAAALAFGASLYATARVSEELPLAWAVLPARVIGVVAVAVPLFLSSRLLLTRPALPLVVTSGVAEIVGFGLFALGSRHGIAVSAVLASQFAGIAAVVAFFLFRERLARVQIAGVVVIVAGVAVLSWLQA